MMPDKDGSLCSLTSVWKRDLLGVETLDGVGALDTVL